MEDNNDDKLERLLTAILLIGAILLAIFGKIYMAMGLMCAFFGFVGYFIGKKEK